MKNLAIVSAIITCLFAVSCKKEVPKPEKPTQTLPVPKDKLIM